MRRLGVLLVPVCCAVAAAQDRDPFDAVADAERVRARQMTQVQRADDRATDPFGSVARTPSRTAPATRPADGAAPHAPAPASRPWLVPLLGAVAGAGVWLLVRARRRRD